MDYTFDNQLKLFIFVLSQWSIEIVLLQEADLPQLQVPGNFPGNLNLKAFFIQLHTMLTFTFLQLPITFTFLLFLIQLHTMLNEIREVAEQKAVTHRDFYNVRKVSFQRPQHLYL